MMDKPTQMMAFDGLCGIAARDGRGQALFGTNIQAVRTAYEKTLIGDGYPDAYLEFPLLGEPCLDLLSVYGRIEPGVRFAPGAGYGYQAMADWFSTVKDDGGPAVSCGIEVDCSVGQTERAGAYLQQRRRRALVRPFLASVGEGCRAQAYLDLCDRMPRGWRPSYVGLFPGRAGAPMRIGGYLSDGMREACATNSSLLGRAFDAVGFCAYNQAMLRRCSALMAVAPSVDFQFDLLPDGTLGDTFGLSLSFNETRPREARTCMESGYGARLMGMLEGWGLADDRWRLVAGAAYARQVGFTRPNGEKGDLALLVLLNYAKVKFTAAEAMPAKFYLLLGTRECQKGLKPF